jgi:hypothetical protein
VMGAAGEDLRVEVAGTAVYPDVEAVAGDGAVAATAFGRLEAAGLDHDRNRLVFAGCNRPVTVLEAGYVVGRYLKIVMTWSANVLVGPVELEMSLFGTGPEGVQHQRWTSTPLLSERGMHDRSCLADSCGPVVRRTLPWEWSAWVEVLLISEPGSLELLISGNVKSKRRPEGY